MYFTEDRLGGRFTPTAAWFRWLQYLRQREYLLNNQQTTGGADPSVGNTETSVTHSNGGQSTLTDATKNDKRLMDIASQAFATDKRPQAGSTNAKANSRVDRLSNSNHGNGRPLTVHDHSHPDHDHSIHHG